MPAYLLEKAFEPLKELANYQNQHLRAGSFGACTQFTGTMRDFNASNHVKQMVLEHYPEMTQKYLDKLCLQALGQWEIEDCLIIHRFGLIKPGDPIVLTAAWSAHREQAFAACRFLIEELKNNAPFWKKETINDGERWVHDTPH